MSIKQVLAAAALISVMGIAPATAQKISDLPDGSPGAAGDLIPIARTGSNFYLPFSAFSASFNGGTFTAPLLGPVSLCDTAPPYSFTGRTTLGLCSPAAETVEVTATNGSLNAVGHVDTAGSGVEGRFTVTRGSGEPESDLRTQATSTDASFSATGNDASGSPTKSYSFNALAGSTSHQLNFSLGGSGATQAIDGLFNAEATSSNFLSFTNVTTPEKTILFTQDTNTPSLTIMTGDGIYTGSSATSAQSVKIEATGTGFDIAIVDVNPAGVSIISSISGQTAAIYSTADGVKLHTQGTKSTCDSNVRGYIWIELGGIGVADTVEMCTKDGANAYAWRSLLP